MYKDKEENEIKQHPLFKFFNEILSIDSFKKSINNYKLEYTSSISSFLFEDWDNIFDNHKKI